MKNKTKVWLMVFIVITIFSFYWFSLRPEQIKKECYKISLIAYGTIDYDTCLRQHGLE